MTAEPMTATVLQERDDDPLSNVVEYAMADMSIVLRCPSCDEVVRLGPRIGPHSVNLPWLASLCPGCGARFRVVTYINITWQP